MDHLMRAVAVILVILALLAVIKYCPAEYRDITDDTKDIIRGIK